METRSEQTPSIKATMDAPIQIKHRHPWLRRVASVALLVLASLLLAIVAFRFVNPPINPVAIAEKLRSKTLGPKHWVQLTDISQDLPLAVIASEDGRFCDHWGVDWGAVRDATLEGGGVGGFRGASTIPMQTVKNLYLWPERSYVRKVLEVPLAYLLSALWPKRIVMETYLNIAPWGRGTVGAEAASRRYFHKGAGALTRREAALLVAALPAPNLRNPAKPSPRMLGIAQSIERKMPIPASRSACLSP